MPVEIIMPKVDMDMASGTIADWFVAEGAAVEKGEPLFTFETDKSAMEVEAPASGVLHHRTAEGTEVPIGEAVGWLYAEGEAVGKPSTQGVTAGDTAADDVPAVDTPAEDRPAEHRPAKDRPAEDTPTGDGRSDDRQSADTPTGDTPSAADRESAQAPRAAGAAGGTRATPRARSLARDAGLDLASLRGSGPRGRIQSGDVRAATDGGPAARSVGDFTVETGPLAVTRAAHGTGAPLVMIHGFASDALSWTPLEGPLGRRPLIRIDLPGHGKSPARPVDGFEALLDEVGTAFDALSTEPVHLLGHSLGGAVCLALADSRPERVASLTLIAPAGLGPDIDGEVLAGICRATRPESLGPWLRELVADASLVTDAYVRLAMAGRAGPNLRAAQTAMASALFPDGVQAINLRRALARVSVPTRIVWGKGDVIIPWTHALQAPGRVGLHLFDGVGHLPHIEQADEVAAIIRAQLAEAVE